MVLKDNMNELRNWLEDRCKDCTKSDEPMSLHTSFRTGGPADIFVLPDTIELACEIIMEAEKKGIPVFMTGDGTNLVVSDSGIRGLVMSLNSIPSDLSYEEKPDGTVLVSAHAGVKTRSICRTAIENGFSGMNFALGIPGTIGGNVAMNAGTHLGAIGDVVHSLRIFQGDGKVKDLLRKDMSFSYRKLDCHFLPENKKHPVITGVTLSLFKGDKEVIYKEAKAILQKRTASQPISMPNAGCIFKNPEGMDPAGKLIDMAGLKGKTRGGAMISDVHANFITNTGNAKSADIFFLVELAKKEVFRLFKIELETEVKFVGL